MIPRAFSVVENVDQSGPVVAAGFNCLVIATEEFRQFRVFDSMTLWILPEQCKSSR